VSETLSLGPEGRYLRRPRWLGPAAGLLAAAVLAGLAARAGGGVPDRPPVVAPTFTQPSPMPSPTPLPTAPVFRLDGEPGAGPAVRLLVAGPPAGVLDTRTGRLAPLPGVRATGPGLIELDRGRGLTTALVSDSTGLSGRGWVLPDGGHPVALGPVADVLPMRDGTVLTETCLVGSEGGCGLTARTAAGAVRWRRTLLGRLDLLRDTPYGLLSGSSIESGRGQLRLEDPRTGSVRQYLRLSGWVVAADDRRVAYQPARCETECPVLLADLAERTVRQLTVPPGRVAAGAFAPDGERLALGFQGLPAQDPEPSRDRDGYAVVLDLRRGSRLSVPGLTTGAKAVPVPVWTPDGSRLLLAATDAAGYSRVVCWRPGADHLTVLPVRLRGYVAQAGGLALPG
jgi:hypothetical protein